MEDNIDDDIYEDIFEYPYLFEFGYTYIHTPYTMASYVL